MLLSDPVDQLVELDRLLGRGQCVTGRKSVLTGGLSSDAGGSGKAGHWCVSASTGIGCGFGLDAQLLSASANGSQTGLKIMFGPFIDGLLIGGDALGVGQIGGAGLGCGGAIIGDGGCEGRLLLLVELLEARALFPPVARLGFLDEEQDRQRETDADPGHALPVEELEDH